MADTGITDDIKALLAQMLTLQQTVNNVAAMQAAILTQLAQAPAKPAGRLSLRRRRGQRKLGAKLGAIDPNAGASPQSVSDMLSGTDGGGGQLAFRKAAMLYEANMFGLGTDYAFPEGANVSSSLCDHGTTLAKLLTRKLTLPDGNQYDAWDAIMTAAKAAILSTPLINDDEINSVNHKKP